MRSPLDSVVASYVLIGLALVCFGVCVVLYGRKQGVRPIRKILRIFELPFFKAVFLLSRVVGIVRHTVLKGDAVRLFHSGTKEDEETDYDYTLRLTGEVPANVLVVDSDSLLTLRDPALHLMSAHAR